jgi:hypothetical protein
VLLSLRSRGLASPKLAAGDGAMGFWTALEEIFPTTRQQRCWMHKTGNVLNYLPKRTQPKAKKMLHDIWQAETREDAHASFDLFIGTFEAKYPKATECLLKDRDELLTFYDFPAQHWQSIRTSNPIESAFATIRHRTKRTKGCLSRDGMLHIPHVTFLRNALPGSGCSSSANVQRKVGANCAASLISRTSSKASISSTASSHQTKIKPPHDDRLDTRFDSSSVSEFCRAMGDP